MPAKFWTEWQLWEKMCFVCTNVSFSHFDANSQCLEVLASAIVLVVVAGLIKLMYNRHCLRKYSKLAATQAELRRTFSRSGTGKRGKGAEVPFGIRAIESGIEVDGVWISGSNSPASSAPGSPTLSATTEKPKVSSRDSAADTKRQFGQPPNVDLPSPIHSYHKGGHSVGVPSGRPSYQPRRSSGLRFSDSYELGDYGTALDHLETRSVILGQEGSRPSLSDGRALGSRRRSNSWSTTSFNQTQDGTIQSAVQSEPVPDNFTHPRYQSMDKGKATASLEITADQHCPSHSANPISDSLTEASDPFLTPTQTRSNNGASTSASGPHYDADEHTENTFVAASAYNESDHQQQPDPLHSTRSSFTASESHCESDVLRIINSGFEILQPGTLDRAAAASGSRSSSIGAGSYHAPKRQSKRFPLDRNSAPAGTSDGVVTRAMKSDPSRPGTKKLQKRKAKDSLRSSASTEQ